MGYKSKSFEIQPVVVRFILAGVMLTAVFLYLPPYLNSFVGDDFVQQWRIREFVNAPATAYRIFHPFWTNWYYRPLQNVWSLGNRLQFGLNPAAYYFLQVCWHLLVVALLYRLGRLLRLPAWAALVAAAVFAINSQHQLTVSWISSIAIVMGAVFSLAAAVVYLVYLNGKGGCWLAVAIVFCLLAMLAHEEGFITPLLLFALWWTQPKWPSFRLQDILFFSLLLLLMVGYIYLQIVRPNVHLAVEGTYFTRLAAAVWPANFGQFELDVLVRWLGLNDGIRIAAQPIVGTFAGLGLLVLLGMGFWGGRRPVRIGLLWAGLHLGFIYLGLWSQRPELFDGRHLYNGWLGICLALGGGLAQLVAARPGRVGRREKRRLLVVIMAVLLLFISGHIWQTQSGMTRFYNLTQTIKAAEADMKTILPTVSDQTQVFAVRFPLTAPYFVPTAGVWYDRPDLKGGSLDLLTQYDVVTEDFYLFDYEDNQLYDLMPELHRQKQTIFLWRDQPVTVAGPAGERRLAIKQTPPAEGWASLNVTQVIPVNSQLAFAIRGIPGHTFRLQVGDTVLYNYTITPDETDWQEITLPLDMYAGDEVVITLELNGRPDNPGYWANPRLVKNGYN
ncbi:MAG: hypothetical protein GY796_06190 [Chloroflexi bacterium]|nr:hypothetical protein [Chloroflexota bacterium]